MNLDLSKFKKVKEDKGSAILRHARGHEIRIAKSALSPKLQQSLASLPMHLDEGGSVPEEELAGAAQKNPNQPTIIINNGPQAVPAPEQVPEQPPNEIWKSPKDRVNLARPSSWDERILQSPVTSLQSKVGALQEMEQMEATKQIAERQRAIEQQRLTQQYNQLAAKRGIPPMPNIAPAAQLAQAQDDEGSPLPQPGDQSQSPAEPVPGQPLDPFGSQAFQGAYMNGLNEQKVGIGAEAEALGQQAKAQSAVLQQGIQDQQARMKSYEEHTAELNGERAALLKDYAAGHIDPNHLVSNMGTVQKISTAIGLILGGMGGGLTGQENPALKLLNDNINRDIDAQKAELGKKQNLLSANQHQFGNLHDATAMTRVMQSDIVSNQLKQAAAATTDPLVKARALRAAGALDMQAAPIMAQLAMKRSIASSMQGGAIPPSTAIRMIVPEHQQAAAYKELGDMQEKVAGRDNALRAFDDLVKVNTVEHNLFSPMQTSRQVKSTRNILAVALARATAGRVNEYEFEAAKDLYPQAGDSDETQIKKRRNLLNLIQEKMHSPILESYGIRPNIGGRYDNAGEKKIQLGPPVVPVSR